MKKDNSNKNNITRYLEIFLDVSRRNNRSNECKKVTPISSIDKIILSSNLGLEIDKIGLKPIKFKEGWFYEISIDNNKLYLSQGYTVGKKIHINPSSFHSWNDCFNFLKMFLKESINNYEIYRLDLALDYPIPLEHFLKSFDVTRKKSSWEYFEKGTKKTGVRIGKRPEVISIYDKTKRHNLNSPWTRIEIQLYKQRAPVRSIEDLPKLLLSNNFDPFKNIELFNLQIKKENSKQSNEFEILWKYHGFYHARRELSTNNNFKRDYSQCFNKELWNEQPNQIFKRKISNYFN